jgi:ribonuclease P protein component
VGDARFTRDERIRNPGEIKLLFKKGLPVRTGGAKLFVAKNETGKNRIAFTFPRHFGNAVERNRAKRLCREASRLRKNTLRPGHDLLLLLFPADSGGQAARETFRFRDGQFAYLCRRAGLLGKTP